MPAALTVRRVPVMVPKAALRADNILLRCDMYPFPYKTAHLPGYENHPRDDHHDRYQTSRLRKRNNITETDRCEGHDREIKGIAEILDSGVDRTFNGIEKTRRDKKYHKNCHQKLYTLQDMDSNVPEEEIRVCGIPQEPEDPEDTESPDQTEEPHIEYNAEERTHKKRHCRQDRYEIYHTVDIDQLFGPVVRSIEPRRVLDDEERHNDNFRIPQQAVCRLGYIVRLNDKNGTYDKVENYDNYIDQLSQRRL